MYRSITGLTALIAVVLGGITVARAQTPAGFLASFQQAAGGSLSARRGEQFFKARHGAEWSCASCHTANPAATGRHAKTGKSIAPLAPAANPKRFTRPAKVSKWFKRNCNDVLGRECSAREKGDVLAYLLGIRH